MTLRCARAVAVAGCLLSMTASCRSGRAPQGERAEGRPTNAAPRFVRGPTKGSPIAPFVKSELARATRARENVLVYVGAKWCEPCQRFHEAVEKGLLTESLPSLVLVEFDLDDDRDALAASGYASRLIPLFALPEGDGRGGSRRIEGSVKSPEAVEQDLVPRLKNLLGDG